MKHTKKLAAFGPAVALVLAYVVAVAVAPVVNQYFIQQNAANDINQRTGSAEFAMDTREWFAQQREDIKSMQRQIENQRTQIRDFKERHDMDELSYTQQKQYNRMTNRLLGYRNQYETYVADYNAKMNVSYYKQYNKELPLDMQEKFWTGDLIP